MKFSGKGRTLKALFAGIILAASANLSAAEYSASFKGTDIHEFINIVGKNLNKTIIIDPAVRGKINVRSYDLLNDEQYYQFFLNVLDVYGFAVVKMDNGILKIIKAKDAKVSAIPVVDGKNPGQGDEMVTRVVPVRNVSVRELAPLLRQLNDNAGGGNVVHYDPSNVIMITGRAAVVNRLVEIVRRVDKAGDEEVDIVKLRFASAGEMVRILESIQKPASGGKNTTPNLLKPRMVADERTNSIIISGEPKARQRAVQLVRQLDSELETSGNTRVFYLKYAKAKEMVDVLKGVSKSIEVETKAAGGKGATKSTSKSSLSIEAHEGTNAIVITAQPDVMGSLENVIRQLDIRRAQVLVEAIIVEVAEGDGIGLSVQWATMAGGTQFQNNGASLGDIAAGVYEARPEEGSTIINSDGTTTQNPDTKGDVSALAGVLKQISGMAVGYVGNDWGVVLQAIASSTGTNILATPSITTLDNQEASFIVGDEVPVKTGSAASSGNDNPFTTIERKKVGIQLKVTPQINEGDAVQLIIEQEVSNVNGNTGVDITFATRAVKTTVLADSGDTIVIGGLIDESIQESVDKVPLLGDIPYLGNLFKSTSSSTKKRNLMIFIRPTIIRDSNKMASLSSRKYSLMRAVQLSQQEDGVNLMPNTDVPVLPEWGQSPEINPEAFDFTRKNRRAPEKAFNEKAEETQQANPIATPVPTRVPTPDPRNFQQGAR
ncbi:type II secretion system secretin GspD [Motilimonas pumila]|uniref:Type II secretion system protein GspD n=1 Tax=Motilimonas pumila TaxID=2303987 RepID=A0A418YKX3_9GAMM|nr:type II secretion system secretin GspD [Motilimonas pumila]RJG51621.1 type II secretion system protein GspD [Motilimonas pumila]